MARDALELLVDEAWSLIAAAVADARAAFHWPTVATIGSDGSPRLRTVVLRAADPKAGTLRFHTDLRSAKIDELALDARIAVHFFDPGRQVQVRIAGRATVAGTDGAGRSAWETARRTSLVAYGLMPAPGTPIAAGGDYRLPETPAEIDAGAAHFAAVTVAADGLEWLSLDAGGHRRARFVRAGPGRQGTWQGGWQGTWLVP